METGMPYERIEAIDRVKACAIVAVVVTHAGPDRWSPHLTATDYWMRYAWTSFHVPAFLMMAGVLYRTAAPMTTSVLRRRLARVVVPYCVVLTGLYALGIAALPPLRSLPFAILTGASYGIYYFVPVLVLCLGFGWLLSRLSSRAISSILIALTIYALLAASVPPLTPVDLFWRFRDPFSQFWFGYFALGWIGAPAWVARRVPRWCLAAVALVGIILWSRAGFPGPVPIRIFYTVAIVGLLWTLPLRFAGMRLLSEATLGLYLLHRPLLDATAPFVSEWPPTIRITVVAIGSLGAAVGLCLAARGALGQKRARTYLGA
jgi:fucose 4-O-acetylase-like acetyltransferase